MNWKNLKPTKKIIPTFCLTLMCVFFFLELQTNSIKNVYFFNFLKRDNRAKCREHDADVKNMEDFEGNRTSVSFCTNATEFAGEKCQWPIYLSPTGGEFLKKFDYDKFDLLEREFLKSRLPIYLERAERVASYCLNHGDLLKARDRIYLWDYKERNPSVVFCFIQKVASTKWISNFLLLADFNLDNPEILELPVWQRRSERFSVARGWNHDTALLLYRPPNNLKEKVEIFKNSLRFLVVRHPFTRILSAYRVKMLKKHPNIKDDWRYSQIREDVIQKYRKNTTNTSNYPTFSEYVDFLIENLENLRRTEEWTEFPVNVFQRQSETCNVCGSDYNLIMKLETVEEDQNFLAILADMKQIRKKIKLPKFVRRLQNNKSSYELSPEFYKTLTKKQMMDLYTIYRDDFELFDYTIDDYLEMAES